MDSFSIPDDLEEIKPYIRMADEYDAKDPLVSYYCRVYAAQRGIVLSTVNKDNVVDTRTYLLGLMDQMEQVKKDLTSSGTLENDIVGQAYLEQYAQKLLTYADSEDKASRFTKSLVKTYYIVGLLFDVLTMFGDLSDSQQQNGKYAKLKAAYIDKCLETGETPIAGYLPEEGT